MAQKINSQRAFARVCEAGVDRYPRKLARLDRPIKLAEIDQNIGFKSTVPNRVGSLSRCFAMLHQPPPQVVRKLYVPGSDQAVQIPSALRITEQRRNVDLTEYRCGFHRPRLFEQKTCQLKPH